MKILKKYGYYLLFLIVLSGCKKHKLKTYDSDFQHLYNQLIKPNNKPRVSWDTEVHSYTFILNTDKKVALFGYQSQKELKNTDYLIEIIRNSDSAVIYSDGHQFNDTKISYVAPSYPVNLQSGVAYTLKRIQTNWTQYITETIGHIIRTEESDYPLQYGALTITETDFHDVGSASKDWTKFHSLSRIDLVLE
jgi:hypothetical protein